MMTEKRFTLFDDGETIIDNETVADDGGKQIYWTVEYVQRQKLVDLLNALHKENEQLKLLNNYLMELLKDLNGVSIEIEKVKMNDK